jgi:tRNA modification GTPase
LSVRGVPILLTDTAGLRSTDDEVEAIGVARSAALIGTADILLWLGEPAEAPEHPRLVLVHAKADLHERSQTQPASLGVSAKTGFGLAGLLERIGEEARAVLPGEGAIALNRRQATHIAQAAEAFTAAARATELVILAEALRHARSAFDRLTGRAGVEDVLDALFSRFCLGK